MDNMRVLVGVLILLLAAPVSAIDFFSSKKDDNKKSSNGPSLEQRVQMLERRINTLSNIVLRLDSLQQEIQQLRGDVEVQNHNMESLRKRQMDFYNDMDQRISRLTGEAPAGLPAGTTGGMMPPASAQGGYQTQPQAPEPAGEPNWESTPVSPEANQPGGMGQNPPSAPAAGGIQQQTSGSKLPPVVSSTSPSTAEPTSPGQLQTTTVAVAPKPSTPYREAKGEKSSYQTAFNLLMDRKYDRAKESFRLFLTKYPRSRLADNAQYWLAEANYVTRNFDVAKTEFNKVINAHPGSPKVSDAMLKIGYIQYEKKRWSEARDTLNSVVNRYPNSTASQLAKKRLSKMRAQGH
jgi:tol-pal system protein YbgF